jgi:hypothetical protein
MDDLVATIERVRRGELLCSPRTAATLFRRLESLSAGRREQPAVAILTKRDRATSSCIPPESARQLLATGRSTTPEFLGATGFKIRATLPGGGRRAPVTVSADVQTLANAGVRIRLFDAGGGVLATGEATTNSEGKCPNANGGDRGRATVTASINAGTLAYAIVEEVSGGLVFIVDTFTVT